MKSSIKKTLSIKTNPKTILKTQASNLLKLIPKMTLRIRKDPTKIASKKTLKITFK